MRGRKTPAPSSHQFRASLRVSVPGCGFWPLQGSRCSRRGSQPLLTRCSGWWRELHSGCCGPGRAPDCLTGTVLVQSWLTTERSAPPIARCFRQGTALSSCSPPFCFLRLDPITRSNLSKIGLIQLGYSNRLNPIRLLVLAVPNSDWMTAFCGSMHRVRPR